MIRKTLRIFILSAAALIGLGSEAAQAGWSVGVRLGGPVYYRPYYGPGPYYYYPPYPVYVQPAPIVVQPAPVVQPVYAAPAPVTAQMATREEHAPEIEQQLHRLADPNEQVRADAVLSLGRLKSDRAIDPLAATLAGDRSPTVREAAARSLGLIGSPRALPVLRNAAQVDSDRDVRHSAQFAIEVVQSR